MPSQNAQLLQRVETLSGVLHILRFYHLDTTVLYHWCYTQLHKYRYHHHYKLLL
jgi:hypothetical protein